MPQYYKVLNEKFNHYGFQYTLGLNVDVIDFNPRGDCEPGGFYYTDADHLVEFLYLGCYIAEIEVPADAKVYKSPRNNKWKADKIVILSYRRFNDHPLFHDDRWCNLVVDFSASQIKLIPRQTRELCLKAVRRLGYALEFIGNQTEELCLEAVRHNGDALQHVKTQTPAICRAALDQNRYAVQYIKIPYVH